MNGLKPILYSRAVYRYQAHVFSRWQVSCSRAPRGRILRRHRDTHPPGRPWIPLRARGSSPGASRSAPSRYQRSADQPSSSPALDKYTPQQTDR